MHSTDRFFHSSKKTRKLINTSKLHVDLSLNRSRKKSHSRQKQSLSSNNRLFNIKNYCSTSQNNNQQIGFPSQSFLNETPKSNTCNYEFIKKRNPFVPPISLGCNNKQLQKTSRRYNNGLAKNHRSSFTNDTNQKQKVHLYRQEQANQVDQNTGYRQYYGHSMSYMQSSIKQRIQAKAMRACFKQINKQKGESEYNSKMSSSRNVEEVIKLMKKNANIPQCQTKLEKWRKNSIHKKPNEIKWETLQKSIRSEDQEESESKNSSMIEETKNNVIYQEHESEREQELIRSIKQNQQGSESKQYQFHQTQNHGVRQKSQRVSSAMNETNTKKQNCQDNKTYNEMKQSLKQTGDNDDPALFEKQRENDKQQTQKEENRKEGKDSKLQESAEEANKQQKQNTGMKKNGRQSGKGANSQSHKGNGNSFWHSVGNHQLQLDRFLTNQNENSQMKQQEIKKAPTKPPLSKYQQKKPPYKDSYQKIPQSRPAQNNVKNEDIKIKRQTQADKKQSSAEVHDIEEIENIDFGVPKRKSSNKDTKEEDPVLKPENKDSILTQQKFDERLTNILDSIYLIGEHYLATKNFYEKSYIPFIQASVPSENITNKNNYLVLNYFLLQHRYILGEKTLEKLKKKNQYLRDLSPSNLKAHSKIVEDSIKQYSQQNEQIKKKLKKRYEAAKPYLDDHERVFSISKANDYSKKCEELMLNQFRSLEGEYKSLIKSHKDSGDILINKIEERLCEIIEIYCLIKTLNGDSNYGKQYTEHIPNHQAHYQKYKHLIV